MFKRLWEFLFPKKVVPQKPLPAEPEQPTIQTPQEPDMIPEPESVKEIVKESVKVPVKEATKEIKVTSYPISPVCTEALTIAKTQLGVKELPGNRGPKIKEYLKSVDLNEGNSWCAAFVYWCFQQASRNLNVPNPCYKTAGVLNHWNLTKGIKVKMPRTGDIFILDHGKGLGHTGMVKTVSEDKKTYTTVEGNSNTTGSREGTEVCSNNRKITDALGFIRY